MEQSIKEEKKEIKQTYSKEEISLNAFLSNHGDHQRNLDGTIKKWYMKKDNSNPNKSKEDWKKIVEKFFGETEK